jgi:signal peptide peptidase SppA
MQKDSGIFGGTSTRDVRRAVRTAAAKTEVKSIVLVIDSPGGSVDGLAELGDSVAEATRKKRVIAQVDGMAASAGYYVASQANRIFAGRMDLVGSLGSKMVLVDTSLAATQQGIRVIPVDTGDFKSAGEPGTEITPAQVQQFQRLVDQFGQDFKKMIRRGRKGMSHAEIDAVFDGRIWTAADALDLGLIDGIATLDETINREQPSRNGTSRRQRLAVAKAKIK